MGPGITWKGNIKDFYNYVFGRDTSYAYKFACDGIASLLPWFMDVEDVDVSFIKPNLSDDGFASIRVATQYYLLSHFAQKDDGSIVEVDSTMRTVFEAELKKKGRGLGKILYVATYLDIPGEDSEKVREHKLISLDGLGDCLKIIYPTFNLENEFVHPYEEIPPESINYEIISDGGITVSPAKAHGTLEMHLHLFSIATLAMAQMALLSGIFSFGEDGSKKERLEEMLNKESKAIDWRTCRLTAVDSKKVVITLNEAGNGSSIELALPMPQRYIPEKERVKVNYIGSFEL